MKSNVVRMTNTNDSITFYRDAIVIQPTLSDSFVFNGSPMELLSILVYHKDIDMTHCVIRVRDANYRVIPRSEERQMWIDKYGDKNDI